MTTHQSHSNIFRIMKYQISSQSIVFNFIITKLKIDRCIYFHTEFPLNTRYEYQWDNERPT